jgi:ABC-2 type transport system ATP-binding protein
MATDFVIETQGLTKHYKQRAAVEDLSISVPAGVVAGFVGPNGAGKTTTISMMLGLISPTAGSARVLGESIEEPSAYLREVGALIERPAFYPGLSGEENLRVLSTVGGYDHARIGGLLDQAGLAGRGGDRFGTYSLGMKQRLGIAAAMLGDPALLVLDEPTNGLDPEGIHEMRQLIRQLADEGRTIFLSSHVLAELEQVCDWFVIIDHGKLMFQGTAAELMDGAATSVVFATEQRQDTDRLRKLIADRGHKVQLDDCSLAVSVERGDPRALAAEISRAAMAEGVVLVELRVERMNLEERYLAMANGGPR